MKDKIIRTAIEVFNDKGLAAVSMKQIADELGISAGNLSYHYKSKAILLHAIRDEITAETQDFFLPSTYLTLHHLEVMVNAFHQHTLSYKFIFNDFAHISRHYPTVAAQHNELNLQRLIQGKTLIDYYVDSDRMYPEREGISYDYLVFNVWALLTFWPVQELALNSDDYALKERTFMTAIWNLFLPNLTEKGLAEYREIKKYVHQNPADISEDE
jgi:AcrR family transcriptional regulator